MGRVVAVVPARLASSRFPNKPLARILDLPMVEHVRRRAALADLVDEVAVATCDRPIAEVVEDAGGRVIMTADSHRRCTERVEEAMRHLEGEIVVIAQGDEPLLLPEAVRAAVLPLLEDRTVAGTNVLSPIGASDFTDPDVVKAACDQAGNIMFLSRAAIPHFSQSVFDCPVYRQTGLMALRLELVRRFATLPESPFERAESIDMLRFLEHGYRIRGVPVRHQLFGVDRPSDVPAVERILRSDPAQAALHRRITAAA